jgi:hypothetical protein
VIFFQGIAEMAAFCLKCVEDQLNFGTEVYKLFTHPSCAEGSKRLRSDQPGDEV